MERLCEGCGGGTHAAYCGTCHIPTRPVGPGPDTADTAVFAPPPATRPAHHRAPAPTVVDDHAAGDAEGGADGLVGPAAARRSGRDRLAAGWAARRHQPRFWFAVTGALVMAANTTTVQWLMHLNPLTAHDGWLVPAIFTALYLAISVMALVSVSTLWFWAVVGWVPTGYALQAEVMWPVYLTPVAILSLMVQVKRRWGTQIAAAWVGLLLWRHTRRRDDATGPRPHTLYRHFDAHGRLLYVGKTDRPAYLRSREHAKKDWFAQVTQTTYERFSSREHLHDAEVRAIRAERPVFNVQHNRR